MLKYKLSGAPRVNELERSSCSLSYVWDPGSNAAAPLAPPPPALPLPHISSSCFSLFSKKTGQEPNAGIRAVQGLSLRPGAEAVATPHTEPSEPSLSQWPKWLPIYLQKVNSRCHGNGTSPPGPVKIHLRPPLGRGQKGKRLQLQGENERRGGTLQARQSRRDPAGFSRWRARPLLPLFITFNNNKIIDTGLRDTNRYPHVDSKKTRETKQSYCMKQGEARESLVSLGASANAGGGTGGWGHVRDLHEAWSALSISWGEDAMTISSVFCLYKRNCPDWVRLAGWRSLIFFLGTRILSSFTCDSPAFFFFFLLHFFFFLKCSGWEVILFSRPHRWPFVISR